MVLSTEERYCRIVVVHPNLITWLNLFIIYLRVIIFWTISDLHED